MELDGGWKGFEVESGGGGGFCGGLVGREGVGGLLCVFVGGGEGGTFAYFRWWEWDIEGVLFGGFGVLVFL